jgi:hypothetical protein
MAGGMDHLCGRSNDLSCKHRFNYPENTETVEAPSPPLHKLADLAVVDCHEHSEGKSGLSARQLRLPGCKLAIDLGTGFSLPSNGPGILPTTRRIVERGLPLLV